VVADNSRRIYRTDRRRHRVRVTTTIIIIYVRWTARTPSVNQPCACADRGCGARFPWTANDR